MCVSSQPYQRTITRVKRTTQLQRRLLQTGNGSVQLVGESELWVVCLCDELAVTGEEDEAGGCWIDGHDFF